MKTLNTAFLSLVLVVLSAMLVSLRAESETVKLISPDGSKTLDVELVRYDPKAGTVIYRREGSSQHLTAKVSSFAAETKEALDKIYQNEGKKRALELSSKSNGERFDEKQGQVNYSKEKESYDITVTNRADFDLGALTARYEILLTRYDKGTDDVTMEVESGEESLGSLAAGESTTFTTKEVTITTGASSTSDKKNDGGKTVKQGRERVYGATVTVLDGDGTVLSEYYTSNSVRVMMEKMKAEEESKE